MLWRSMSKSRYNCGLLFLAMSQESRKFEGSATLPELWKLSALNLGIGGRGRQNSTITHTPSFQCA